MTRAEISGISPFFIVSHVPSSLSFYRDLLGFEVTFQGPAPDDIFFGIVRRGGAQILLKDVGVTPMPNYTRDVKKGIARWDAFVDVPDPDALAAEFASRSVELFEPLKDTDDGLRGFELKDADGYVLFFWSASVMSAGRSAPWFFTSRSSRRPSYQRGEYSWSNDVQPSLAPDCWRSPVRAFPAFGGRVEEHESIPANRSFSHPHHWPARRVHRLARLGVCPRRRHRCDSGRGLQSSVACRQRALASTWDRPVTGIRPDWAVVGAWTRMTLGRST